jgi:hypothetical protein
VQNDAHGSVWLVEDIGGSSASGGKKPNSYVYRFEPTGKSDLTKGGTLQALQVKRSDGTPATAAQLQADPADPFIADLHTYGTRVSPRQRLAGVLNPAARRQRHLGGAARRPGLSPAVARVPEARFGGRACTR